jgi:hypothetical protein
MSAIQARGYILASTAGYLREVAGEKKAEDALASASPELREALRNTQAANWYPSPLFAELNRLVVATLAGEDEAKALDVLIKCGRFMGREASNTFLRLLLRMLTPKMIVKKFPDIWKRDFSGGRIQISATDRTLECFIFDLPGHDHIGPISAGWMGFNLEAMGKSLEKTSVQKWSLKDPNQDGVSFGFTWKD